MNSVNGVKVACAAVSAAVLGMAGNSVQAFKPEYESHGHTMITRSVLGAPEYRFGDIDGVSLVVSRFTFQFAGFAETGFAKSWAINHIVKGVQSRDLGYPTDGTEVCTQTIPRYKLETEITDRLFRFGPSDGFEFDVVMCSSVDLDSAGGHFDNDNFLGSLASLRGHLLASILYAQRSRETSLSSANLMQERRIASRLMLGKALHTLQDFYAHSNWVELRGHNVLAEFITAYVLTGDPAFSARIELAEQTQRKIGSTFPPGQGGGFAHGDTCAGRDDTSWDQTWRSNDGNYQTDVRTTNAITTSAWWDGLTPAAGWTGAANDRSSTSRCDHGVSDNTLSSTSKFSGIAKDLPAWPPNPYPRGRRTGEGSAISFDESYASTGGYVWPPSVPDTARARAADDASAQHKQASYAAAKHTKVILETFVDLVKTVASTATEADELLAIVFGGVHPQEEAAFVIDRSGTMADILADIKAAVNANMKPDKRYVLVDFVGSNISGQQSNIVVTKGAPSVVSQRLATLEARGGGGCATPTWEAVQAAVGASSPGSTVFVMTDASASDAVQEPAIKASAQAKGIKLIKIISGSCSPLDPSYENGAKGTGGALTLIEHSADGIAAALVLAQSAVESPRTVHTEAGSLLGSKAVSFPTETGVSKLTLLLSGGVSNVSVTQPSGAALTAGTGVTISPVLNGFVYVVANPQQGNWRVGLTGNGSYSLSAYVNAPIDFAAAEHKSVIPVGRPGHEYRPQLAATGQSGRVWLKTQIVDAQAPLTLDLLRLDGSTVASFPMSKMTTDYFEGEVTLPTEAHRLRVRGLDASNTAFARILGQGNVAPQAAPLGRITAGIGATGTWRAGTVNAFAINLKNLGGSDTVSLTAGTLPTGATLTCNPGSITLPGSEQVNVLCSLYLPEIVDRTDFTVNVTSASSSQAVTVLLTPIKLPLSCALDVDGDNRVDPAVDGLLLTRFLLGFKGDALTQGLTISGPRKTSTLVEAFFGNAAQFDVIGRASPAPSATVDGLIMTRLMLGVDDAALLNGITLPAGTQFASASAIRANVIAKCAGGF